MDASSSSGTRPPLYSTGSVSPVSPKDVRRRPRPRRAASEASDDSSASREGSPTCAGPWRDRHRPVLNTAYDIKSPQERSAAMLRSRSRESLSSDELNSPLAASPRNTNALNGAPVFSVKPASPKQASNAPQLPSLSASPSSLSPGSFAATANKRQRNKKLLSLNIAAATSTSGPSSSQSLSGTKSCPPSPMLQEGSSKDLDDMRANVRGELSMKRRGSMPRLTPMSAVPDDGNPVRLIGRNGEDGMADSEEAFPYQLGPREILPGIYLGSEQNAKDATCLQRLGIAYILNVAKEVVCPWTAEGTIHEEDEEGDTSMTSNAPSGNSSGTCSPVQSDSSLSPASAATTVSTETTQEQKTSKAPDRPVNLLRSTASTPNLHAALIAPPHESLAIDKAPGSAPGLPGSVETPPGVRHFARNSLTGRPALEYLHLPWGHDEDNLIARFPTAFAFVDRARSAGGRILIHCQCGVSRSATAVIAFVMREAAAGHTSQLADIHGMHEAYSFVKDKSAWITPNMSLLYQLREWEQALMAAGVHDASSTPSSLTPALASLNVPFGSDEPVPLALSNTDQDVEMDTPS